MERIIAFEMDGDSGNVGKLRIRQNDSWELFDPQPDLTSTITTAVHRKALWSGEGKIILYGGDADPMGVDFFSHFDGVTWAKKYADRGGPTGGTIRAMHGTSYENVWAIGDDVVYFFDGNDWTAWNDTDNGGSLILGGDFAGVFTAGADDTWICGGTSGNEFLYHWTGSWSGNLYSSLPAAISSAGGIPFSIAGRATDDVYLAAWVSTSIIAKWNGAAWSAEATSDMLAYYLFELDDEIYGAGNQNYFGALTATNGWLLEEEDAAWPFIVNGLAGYAADDMCVIGYASPTTGDVLKRAIDGSWSSLSGSNYSWTAIGVYETTGGGATEKYYQRLIRDMLPPGAYDISDDGKIHAIACGLGEILEIAEDWIEQLQKEVLPQTAEDCLDEWESRLSSPYEGESSIASRQAALTAVWRLAIGLKMMGFRSVLAPLLNPEYGFRDTCDDNNVSFEYFEVTGGGSSAETTDLVLTVAGAADAQWDESNALLHAQLIRNHDRDDQITVEGIFDAATLSNGAHAGLVIYESATRAFTFGAVQAAGSTYLKLREWSAAGWIEHYSAAWPGYTAEIAIRYFAGTISCGTAGPWSEVDSVSEVILDPKYVGVYVANDASLNVADLTIDEIRVQYAKQHNNVRLIETPLALATTAARNKFCGFVYRDPTDTGTYDLKKAQRIVDKAKSGHTLWRVGESNSFKCDDPYSLTDRDVLNR